MEYYNLLEMACHRVGADFNKDKYNQFMLYMDLLKEWNNKINLTRIIEDEDIIKKHFIDSINLLQFNEVYTAKNMIDIGTGAGFPGIPIKIMLPDIQVTLLDSLNKRVIFLEEVINKLNLKKIKVIHMRAEEGGRDKDLREAFDIAASRAVANLPALSEYCLPYVKKGGYFIALKGPKIEEEIDLGKAAISALGGEIFKIEEVIIEDTDLKHNLVIIKKEKNTSTIYPRKSKNLNKNPIK